MTLATICEPRDLFAGQYLKRLARAAKDILLYCGISEHDTSLVFTTDAKIAFLNQEYRNKKGPTNVLAFPLETSGPPLPLGEVVVSVETAAREAAADGVSLYRRLTRLMAHGFLHLTGLDHERSVGEEHLMLAREEEITTTIAARRYTMTRLAINVDHVATVRQARGTTEPDPVAAAALCELAGAEGIVVHLREDRRHIQDRDVRLLRETVKTRLNLEMAATPEILDIACELRPDMVTLVPEKRQELTTEGGLDVIKNRKKLSGAITQLGGAGIPVSLFIDPDFDQVAAAQKTGATFVELHTGKYCDAVTMAEREHEFNQVADAAEYAASLGLKVNAGHGLDYRTTRRIARLDAIEELSIGHAVIARAVLVGIDRAVREMLAQMI